MNRTVHRSLLAGSYCTECPSVITGRCWGCRWQPGGSTLGSRPPAGSGWSLSDLPWRKGSFWGCRLHASQGWTRSSQPDPPGAVGSSPWDSDMRVQIIECMIFHTALVNVLVSIRELTLSVVSAGCIFPQSLLLTSTSSLCLYPVGSGKYWHTDGKLNVWAFICTLYTWFKSSQSQTQLTFRYVSPRFSYSNLQSVLCKMLMVDWLTWILRAGHKKESWELNSLNSEGILWLYWNTCVSGVSYGGLWTPCVRQYWLYLRKDNSEASCSPPLLLHMVLHTYAEKTSMVWFFVHIL